MGKRLSKIYTRTGDSGETGLGDGNRIAKDATRVAAIGDVDELNSIIGVVVEELKAEGLIEPASFLRSLQHRIFDLGGEISIPGFSLINEQHVDTIEAHIDAMNSELAPLDNFILPGGSHVIATIHLARSVCRRAERSLVTLAASEEVNSEGLRFLNRLSDYLFVCARHVARVTSVEEVLWEKDSP